MTIPKNFNDHFSKIYENRWPSLLEALQKKEMHFARWNYFVKEKPSKEKMTAYGLGKETEVNECFQVMMQSEILRNHDGLLSYYIMDPGSILAAQALRVQPGDKVLDLCAAPGGKTLILAEALAGNGELIANEFSVSRRERLKKVIQQYVPRNIREHIWVTGYEGARWASQQKDCFDKILVDAPCSGERHLLENSKELAEWNPSRSRHLAQRQYALLAGALLALKKNGRLVYSTCSISPTENDGVIAKLIKKKGELFRLIKLENNDLSPISTVGEPTEFGRIFLPDKKGWGPIYFCVLEKI